MQNARKKLTDQKFLSLLPWVSLGVLTFPILWLLIHLGIRMFFKAELNYNEGWNVYHTVAAISGQLIYDNRNEFTPVNYPPISFLFVGAFGKILGDTLLAGRLIAFISLLLISLEVGYITIKLKGKVYDAIFAGVACLGFFVAYARGYVGINDPQMLAHVFATLALLIYLHFSETNRKLFLVAITVGFGIFIKHNLLAIPVVIALDLFLKSRKDALKFVSYLILVLASFTLITCLVEGRDFISNLKIGRIYNIERAKKATENLFRDIRIPLIASLPWVLYVLKNERLRIISIYLIFSLALGIYTSGGSGTNINMFFDLFISLSIALGLLLSTLREHFQNRLIISHIALAIIPILLISSILKIVPIATAKIQVEIQGKNTIEKKYTEDVAFLANQEEPIICERILLCYLAQKKFEYDPFLTSSMMLTKQLDETTILKQIESGHFKMIQFNKKLKEKYLQNLAYTDVPTPSKNERFTENFLRSVGKNYVLVRETNVAAFYAPKNNSNLTLKESL